MAVTVTSLGTSSVKAGLSSSPTTLFSSVALNPGDVLIVTFSALSTAAGAITGLTWNSLALTEAVTESSTSTQVSIWFLRVLTGATGNIAITATTTGVAYAVTADQVTGLTGVKDQTAVGTGTSGAPATAATATTTQPSELVWGAHVMNGPTGDTDVTTNNGNTPTEQHKQIGTTGSTATTNISMDVMYGTVTATGAYKHSWSGGTSRLWAAVVATFPVAPPAGRAAVTDRVPTNSNQTPSHRTAIASQVLGTALVLSTLLHADVFFGPPGCGPDYDYPNPRAYPYPIALRTWAPQPLVLQQLASQDQFFNGPGCGPDYDWPNPRGAAYPVSLRTWAQPASNATTPFTQTDWPVPRGSSYPISLRTWTQSPAVVDNTQLRSPTFWRREPLSPFTAIRAQDWVEGVPLAILATPPPPPFFETDWPNPRGYPYPTAILGSMQGVVLPDTRTVRALATSPIQRPSSLVARGAQDWVTGSLQGTLLASAVQPPFVPPDQPNPRGPSPVIDTLSWAQSLVPELVGQDQFYGLAGSPTFDWPVPRGASFPIALRTWLQATPTGLLEQPFRQSDWPVPRGPARALDLLTWQQSLVPELVGQDTFFGLAGNPTTDWPNPRGYPYPTSLRTWTDDLVRFTLAGQDQFFGAPGQTATYAWPNPAIAGRVRDLLTWTQAPSVGDLEATFVQTDWPNPRGSAYPVALRTWTQATPLNLLGKDQFFGAPGQGPAYDQPNPRGYAYPVDLRTFLHPIDLSLSGTPFAPVDAPNPRGYPYPVSLRTWTQGLVPVLVGKDTIYGAPGEVPSYDWPNPKIAPQPIDARTWAQSPAVPGTPVATYDWPNPRIAPRSVGTLTWTASPAVPGTPLVPFDWPNPQIARRPIDGLTWLQSPAVPGTPLLPADWPNPRRQPASDRTWAPPSLLALTPAAPTTSSDQSVPRGAVYPVGLRTWTGSLVTTTLAGLGQPFGQTDWPNPRGATASVGLLTWAQSPQPPAPPFAQSDWPNPRGPVGSVGALTWTQSLTIPGTPVLPFDWPNPSLGRAYPIALRTWAQAPSAAVIIQPPDLVTVIHEAIVSPAVRGEGIAAPAILAESIAVPSVRGETLTIVPALAEPTILDEALASPAIIDESFIILGS